jgi:hypothetical protein
MSGIISPQKFANMFGNDFEDNILEIEDAIKFAQKHGVKMSFDMTDREIVPNFSFNVGS